MTKELAVLATVAAGGFVAAQAPANNVLSERVGTLGAASVNFVVGTICVLVLTFAFAGGVAGDEGARTPPWYYWVLGGLGGVAIVVTTLVAVRELGAGGVTAAVIAGQLTLSVVLDRLGVLGLEERAVTWDKVLGIALLAAGTLLLVRD
ncbi:MAG: DMT family transporter [Thermoleophilaceae bacterium]